MELIKLIADIQHITVIAVMCLLCIGAFSTALGFTLLGRKFLESAARQPEMAAMLQVKMLIVAGLLDAISMIGVGMALYFTFASPFIQPILNAATQYGIKFVS